MADILELGPDSLAIIGTPDAIEGTRQYVDAALTCAFLARRVTEEEAGTGLRGVNQGPEALEQNGRRLTIQGEVAKRAVLIALEKASRYGFYRLIPYLRQSESYHQHPEDLAQPAKSLPPSSPSRKLIDALGEEHAPKIIADQAGLSARPVNGELVPSTFSLSDDLVDLEDHLAPGQLEIASNLAATHIAFQNKIVRADDGSEHAIEQPQLGTLDDAGTFVPIATFLKSEQS